MHANGQASDPVLTSGFLVVLDRSGTIRGEKGIERGVKAKKERVGQGGRSRKRKNMTRGIGGVKGGVKDG